MKESDLLYTVRLFDVIFREISCGHRRIWLICMNEICQTRPGQSFLSSMTVKYMDMLVVFTVCECVWSSLSRFHCVTSSFSTFCAKNHSSCGGSH